MKNYPVMWGLSLASIVESRRVFLRGSFDYIVFLKVEVMEEFVWKKGSF